MMSMNSYQEAAVKYAIYPREPEGLGVVYCALGLAGESGELANSVKKILRDDSGLLTTDRCASLRSELGDVMWYAANLAHELGEDLSDICAANLAKVADRRDRNVTGGSGDHR